MIDYALFEQRRKRLVDELARLYPDKTPGLIVLFSDFEIERVRFRQESSFYYYTGITEPATACVIDSATGATTIYIPHYEVDRAVWLVNPIQKSSEDARAYGVQAIEYLGERCGGYQTHQIVAPEVYKHLLAILLEAARSNRAIFTLYPNDLSHYIQQRFVVLQLIALQPYLKDSFVDISPVVARMRRKKDAYELECMYEAITVTAQAHELVAHTVEPEMFEQELHGLIEYTFISQTAHEAFPSIVAAGVNGTILHYGKNDAKIQADDCVVVDIGAEKNYYCADITRTYPASGSFSKRQRELYDIVLETQAFIAQEARPGYWLSNKDFPEQSLNHLARKFLKEKGYGDYFKHGIGHFLGLDVHDVGDYNEPLDVGDVITIEPGIYIRDERIGIRIEDNYWIVDDGAICLSDAIPKDGDQLEQFMKERQ